MAFSSIKNNSISGNSPGSSNSISGNSSSSNSDRKSVMGGSEDDDEDEEEGIGSDIEAKKKAKSRARKNPSRSLGMLRVGLHVPRPRATDAEQLHVLTTSKMTQQTHGRAHEVGLFEESDRLGLGYKYDDEEQEETSCGEDSSATPSSTTRTTTTTTMAATTTSAATSSSQRSRHRPRATADCERLSLSPPHALPVPRIGTAVKG